ncbi:TOPRIM nucleotidyl transferase/hydrolase domain-containing protein [uncultured Brevundimonas sp.]|uniref:ATP-dependent nuclease n=1 Tax=uncultured Brevundimonas sp. TaxID=213418 RepID=UPI0025D97913|nr:TOPRIM nucleotidyl transferase/hydrolase domain-containing protein [uncultured Brevundimonas sp.]
MYIDQLKLWNFRSFGSSADEPVATLGATARVLNMDPASSVFIGRNGAGKSALVQSLLRLFGETRDERSIQAGDFFVPPTERLESQTLRRLFIEATIRFPELETGGSEAEKTVPPAFRHMVVEKAGVVPHIRIRLEATWQLAGTLDGVVEETLYWILGDNVVPFGEADPSLKKKVSVAERSHIVVRYIPASRDVTALTQLTVKSLGRNLMKSIRWEKKAEIDALISEAASKLDQEGGLTRVNAAINSCWSQLNTAETGTTASLSVLAPDLQQIVRTATVMLTPSATGRLMTLEDLSDGQRSLFHFALVKALLDLKLILEGEVAAGDDLPFHPEFSRAPALTVFAFEEPENHLSPFFLSRLLSELGKLTDNPRVQAVLTSHAPAIVGRIDPSAIRHVRRVQSTGISHVSALALPDDDTEAAKFLREAVRAHPEIYFARHAIFGEGPSEEIVIPRLAEALGVPIDRSFVAIVPIGGRHIQHFWKLVEQLGIPHTTLLDLDMGRSSGDYQQFRSAGAALKATQRTFTGDDAVNVERALTLVRPAPVAGAPVNTLTIESWAKAFEGQGIFMSGPLDLDMLMLEAFPAAYKTLPPGATGPQSPNNPARKLSAAQRVLGEGGLGPDAYITTAQADLFPWYAYLFLGGRGKPAVHLAALGELDDIDLMSGCPPVLSRLIAHVRTSLNAPIA